MAAISGEYTDYENMRTWSGKSSRIEAIMVYQIMRKPQKLNWRKLLLHIARITALAVPIIMGIRAANNPGAKTNDMARHAEITPTDQSSRRWRFD